MTESRKQLKIASYILIILAVCTIIELIAALSFGEINSIAIPEGAPENTILIAKIFIIVVSALLLIPQFYIGIKGIRIAKKTTQSKAHIYWAIALLAINVVSLIDPIVGIINQTSTRDNVSSLLSLLLETIILFDYIKYARAVAKGK